MDQEQAKLEKKIEDVTEALRAAQAAEDFFNQASGKLIADLITKRVTLSIAKLTSEAYLKDHTGYVNENAWLRANRKLLADLQRLADPATRKKLRAHKEDLEEQNA